MAAFYSGDYIGAVVAEIGSYASKIGYAGDDYPRAYFRSNVAVLREDEVEEKTSGSIRSSSGSAGKGDAESGEKDDGDGNGNGDGDGDVEMKDADGDEGVKKSEKDKATTATDRSASPEEKSAKKSNLEKESSSYLPRPIRDVRYDYYTRPICRKTPGDDNHDNKGGSPIRKQHSIRNSSGKFEKKEREDPDGRWEIVNPCDDATTGLWYTPTQLELLPTLLRHGYDSSLKAPVEEHPLMMVEKSYNPPPLRQEMMEILFEQVRVPTTFLAKDAALMCYGCGRTTSTVVDIGYSGTTVTPVFEGYVETKGIRRLPVGLKHLDTHILAVMDRLSNRKNGVMPLYQVRYPGRKSRFIRRSEFHSAARLQLALDCRESGAGAAIDTSPGFLAPAKNYELPDGTAIAFPSKDRYAATDLLFGSSPESIQYRERRVQETAGAITHLVDAALAPSDDGGGDDGNESEEKSDKASSISKDNRYSEEAAVGISKRKQKRDYEEKSSKKSSLLHDERSIKQRQYRALHRACAPHLRKWIPTTSTTDDADSAAAAANMSYLTTSPIASMICDAVYRCDREQQAQLLGSVVLGGGGSCLGPTLDAVPDLLREQCEAIIHQHTPGWRLKCVTPGQLQERAVLAWLGGSILASMGTFHDMWITRSEYEEWGTAIVNRKCP